MPSNIINPLKFEDTGSKSQFVGPGVTVELIRIIVPRGQRFYMLNFANYVGDSAAWGTTSAGSNSQWDVYVDGVPARGYSGIKDQLGTPNQPRSVPLGFVGANSELVVTVTNLNADGIGGTYALGCSIQGVYEG